jgi:hypothetical protein
MIALYRGVSPISKAIRIFTRSDYSHAAWICNDGTCIEAWHPGGVRHRPDPYAGHTPGTLVDYFGIAELNQNQARRIEWFLKDKLGAGYDLGGVLRFVSRRRAANPSRWFCSELVLAALQSAGHPILRAEPHEIAPGHLAWSTDLCPLALEVSEAEWRKRIARELCQGFGGGYL